MWCLLKILRGNVSYVLDIGFLGALCYLIIKLRFILQMKKQTFVVFQAGKLNPCHSRLPNCYGWSLRTLENVSGLENWRKANGFQISNQERRWNLQLNRFQECLMED